MPLNQIYVNFKKTFKKILKLVLGIKVINLK